MAKLRIILLALLAWSSISVLADVLPLPAKPDKLVTDLANVLSAEQRQMLEQRLLAYEDTTSTQFAILIEPSKGDETEFDRSLRMVEAWGIGRKGKDNGLLIYVAVNDRKIFVQVGYGLEPVITDGITRLIIERSALPAFKKKQYYEGLNEAVTMLARAAGGEFIGTGVKPEGIPFWVVVLIIIGIFTLLGIIGRGAGKGYGTYGRGGYMGGFGPMGGGGWGSSGGFGGGGGGGGGFGGFGGGGFGGGGAGGSW